jgi:NADPH-dependent 2,4-dienoyl-CoA reductase/sulfur reductase-like enzyme
MGTRIVVLGGGSSGTLAANLLRRHLGGDSVGIVVIDRNDIRDPEIELLKAPGVYGPHALNATEHLRLRDGIEFRHVEVATVSVDRDEVCLMDGTTVGYDVLVIATGAVAPPEHGETATAYGGAPYVLRSEGLGDAHGFVPVDRGAPDSTVRPNVFALGAATGPASGRAPSVAQAEALVNRVRWFLSGATPVSDDNAAVTVSAESLHPGL